jgi:hypothetical protein
MNVRDFPGRELPQTRMGAPIWWQTLAFHQEFPASIGTNDLLVRIRTSVTQKSFIHTGVRMKLSEVLLSSDFNSAIDRGFGLRALQIPRNALQGVG